MPERVWLADVPTAEQTRYYEDRRSHLVELGATDAMIQRWAQEAVNGGYDVAQYLAWVEDWLIANGSCPMRYAYAGRLYGRANR